MSEKLKIDTHIVDDELIIHFIGQMDEDADFKKLLDIKASRFVFDFNKIGLLNSCGIREWISFLEGIPGDVQVTYKNCPQIIIEQMNMVHGFIKEGAKIETFYAPYYCEDCDSETKVLLQTENITEFHAPKINCDKCSKEMEFDAIEAQYFNFLK
ncbi:MAG: hypothetical protein KAG61_04030 [Bacteriovoracaceae bacterium]|nr:hypothetical protein [Bacteriovoracaceae bacterium]